MANITPEHIELAKLLFESFAPEVLTTRGGNPAVIFSRAAGGLHTIIGAYWTGIEWIPAKWMETGYFNDERQTNFDLLVV